MRALGVFWAAVLSMLALGAVVLQILGPPPKAGTPAASAQAGTPAAPPKAVAAPPARVAAAPAPVPAAAPSPPALAAKPAGGDSGRPGMPVPAGWDGQIAAPIPALLEPAPDFPGAMLPRRGPDGRAPMQAYARPFDRADAKPRIAIIMDGIGLSAAESRTAIDSLPPAVDLAISAYASNPASLADLARQRGHELLLSLPMEPHGYPLNDEGPHALLTSAKTADNDRNLQWALSRFEGYAGTTNASDGLAGDRFAGMAAPFSAVAQELAARGVFYVDARPGAPAIPGLAGCRVDLVIDEPPARAAIEAQLARLERRARDTGAALGLAGPPRPIVTEVIAAWARRLAARGITLAPVSALAHAPEKETP